MREVNLHYAKTHLSRLVDEAFAGEEVVIARSGHPLVRLTPFEAPKKNRVLGMDQGKIVLRDDFDAPELEALFYGDADHGDADPARHPRLAVDERLCRDTEETCLAQENAK